MSVSKHVSTVAIRSSGTIYNVRTLRYMTTDTIAAMDHMNQPHEANGDKPFQTRIIPINPLQLGTFSHTPQSTDSLPLEDWNLSLSPSSSSAKSLLHAAKLLQTSSIPVAFPTETVYGLGADATRSSAVQGIFTAKNRPSDNPLIIHIATLQQLRSILQPKHSTQSDSTDPIPSIYHPLIKRFWPGPLTIILPLPDSVENVLAKETHPGQKTFGVRMPANILALALIRLADRPIAAPSANASTRPSPTEAEHVFHDLDGKIEVILDGGSCAVGVESTVVDGLGDVPVILRPGGLGLADIRSVGHGWERTVNVGDVEKDGAIKDGKEKEIGGVRAPGMKYRHYSPRSRVVLFEAGTDVDIEEMKRLGVKERKKEIVVGVVRTKRWKRSSGTSAMDERISEYSIVNDNNKHHDDGENDIEDYRKSTEGLPHNSPLSKLFQERARYTNNRIEKVTADNDLDVLDLHIGTDTKDIARGLFSALRDLDKSNPDVILVEGIPDDDGDDVAAAVMNRLRKAAEEHKTNHGD